MNVKALLLLFLVADLQFTSFAMTTNTDKFKLGNPFAKKKASKVAPDTTNALQGISSLDLVNTDEIHKDLDKEDKPDDALEKEKNRKKMNKAYLFLGLTAAVILIFMGISYAVANAKESQSFDKYMNNGSEMSIQGVLVGMVSGLVFGFIDNFGLFMGMKYLDPILSKIPLGDEDLMIAGYGNTFSDMVGAFLGSFIGKMIEYGTGIHNYPIWTEFLGITAGCILGVWFPRKVLGLSPNKIALREAEQEALLSGVSDSELKRYSELFDELDNTIDKDLKGQVRLSTLKSMPEQFSKVYELLKNADKNGDGNIDKAEYLAILTKLNHRYNQVKLRASQLKHDLKKEEKMEAGLDLAAAPSKNTQ